MPSARALTRRTVPLWYRHCRCLLLRLRHVGSAPAAPPCPTDRPCCRLPAVLCCRPARQAHAARGRRQLFAAGGGCAGGAAAKQANELRCGTGTAPLVRPASPARRPSGCRPLAGRVSLHIGRWGGRLSLYAPAHVCTFMQGGNSHCNSSSGAAPCTPWAGERVRACFPPALTQRAAPCTRREEWHIRQRLLRALRRRAHVQGGRLPAPAAAAARWQAQDLSGHALPTAGGLRPVSGVCCGSGVGARVGGLGQAALD